MSQTIQHAVASIGTYDIFDPSYYSTGGSLKVTSGTANNSVALKVRDKDTGLVTNRNLMPRHRGGHHHPSFFCLGDITHGGGFVW